MHPVLFTIPGIDLPIYSYGVMLGLSFIVGWFLVMHLGQKDGLPKEQMANAYIFAAVGAMLGARILYIVTNWHEFSGAPMLDLINVRKGGLVAYGGFLGGFIGSWGYLRHVRIRLLPWADVVVLALASGLGITRIGCFLYGCDYGRPIPNDAPGWIRSLGLRFPNWELRFPDLADQRGAPAFLHHVHDGLVTQADALSALVYPTQLMEVFNGWIAFGLLLYLRSRTRFRGQIFLIFTAYYGLTRTLMEILRGDTGRGTIGPVSTSQGVGIATLLLAMLAYAVLARRAASDPAGAMALGPGAN